MDSAARAFGLVVGVALPAVIVWQAFDVPFLKALGGCLAAAMLVATGVMGVPRRK